jgi:hypothetical protein
LNPETYEFGRHPRQLIGLSLGDARHDLQAFASADSGEEPLTERSGAHARHS